VNQIEFMIWLYIFSFFIPCSRCASQCNCQAEAFVNIGDFCVANIFGKRLRDFSPLSYVTTSQWEQVSDYFGRRYLQLDQDRRSRQKPLTQSFLILANDEVILVDTSFNYLFSNYRTIGALKFLGCFEHLTKIVITHIQQRTYEAQGLDNDLLRSMSGVQVFLAQEEYEGWKVGTTNENMKQFDDAMFNHSSKSARQDDRSLPIDTIFEHLENNNQLRLLIGETQITPGVETLRCPGVTMGSFCVYVHSSENSHALLVGGLLMHESQVQSPTT